MVDHRNDRVRPSIPPAQLPLPQAAVGTVLLFFLFLGAVFWFAIRVEVNANEIMALVNKTGKTLPEDLADKFGDQVVLYPELVRSIAAATGETEEDVREGYKGIRYDVVKEGRNFPILTLSRRSRCRQR